ncbi:hypothetical protein HQ563_10560 [bacterium]|nr:hypothetical protein [bacterium]
MSASVHYVGLDVHKKIITYCVIEPSARDTTIILFRGRRAHPNSIFCEGLVAGCMQMDVWSRSTVDSQTGLKKSLTATATPATSPRKAISARVTPLPLKVTYHGCQKRFFPRGA